MRLHFSLYLQAANRSTGQQAPLLMTNLNDRSQTVLGYHEKAIKCVASIRELSSVVSKLYKGGKTSLVLSRQFKGSKPRKKSQNLLRVHLLEFISCALQQVSAGWDGALRMWDPRAKGASSVRLMQYFFLFNSLH